MGHDICLHYITRGWTRTQCSQQWDSHTMPYRERQVEPKYHFYKIQVEWEAWALRCDEQLVQLLEDATVQILALLMEGIPRVTFVDPVIFK